MSAPAEEKKPALAHLEVFHWGGSVGHICAVGYEGNTPKFFISANQAAAIDDVNSLQQLLSAEQLQYSERMGSQPIQKITLPVSALAYADFKQQYDKYHAEHNEYSVATNNCAHSVLHALKLLYPHDATGSMSWFKLPSTVRDIARNISGSQVENVSIYDFAADACRALGPMLDEVIANSPAYQKHCAAAVIALIAALKQAGLSASAASLVAILAKNNNDYRSSLSAFSQAIQFAHGMNDHNEKLPKPMSMQDQFIAEVSQNKELLSQLVIDTSNKMNFSEAWNQQLNAYQQAIASHDDKQRDEKLQGLLKFTSQIQQLAPDVCMWFYGLLRLIEYFRTPEKELRYLLGTTTAEIKAQAKFSERKDVATEPLSAGDELHRKLQKQQANETTPLILKVH